MFLGRGGKGINTALLRSSCCIIYFSFLMAVNQKRTRKSAMCASCFLQNDCQSINDRRTRSLLYLSVRIPAGAVRGKLESRKIQELKKWAGRRHQKSSGCVSICGVGVRFKVLGDKLNDSGEEIGDLGVYKLSFLLLWFLLRHNILLYEY
jgi:hypothetical protein